LAAPNLANGVNHFVASGSFENMVFTLQVPEPSTFGGAIVVAIVGTMRWRARRCANRN
jgi:hypothetical protein